MRPYRGHKRSSPLSVAVQALASAGRIGEGMALLDYLQASARSASITYVLCRCLLAACRAGEDAEAADAVQAAITRMDLARQRLPPEATATVGTEVRQPGLEPSTSW